MNAIFQKPLGVFGKIWVWFLLLITFNQAAILVLYYVFIVQPTATSLTTVLRGWLMQFKGGNQQMISRG